MLPFWILCPPPSSASFTLWTLSLYCDLFMPSILRFFAFHPNNFRKLFTVPAPPPPFRTASGGRNPHLPMAAPESIKAEYAKSNRSSCKGCSKTIENKSLRLGLVSKDKTRGFESVKWHHLTCFPPPYPDSPHIITGFSSLKVFIPLIFAFPTLGQSF